MGEKIDITRKIATKFETKVKNVLSEKIWSITKFLFSLCWPCEVVFNKYSDFGIMSALLHYIQLKSEWHVRC